MATANLNQSTLSVKTEYIKEIINGLRTYQKYSKIATMTPEDLKLITDKKNGIKYLNYSLETIGYKIDSECTKSNVVIDGKRTS